MNCKNKKLLELELVKTNPDFSSPDFWLSGECFPSVSSACTLASSSRTDAVEVPEAAELGRAFPASGVCLLRLGRISFLFDGSRSSSVSPRTYSSFYFTKHVIYLKTA